MLILCFSLLVQAQSISIVRHGQAANNTQDVHSTDISGSKAYPLTELGRSQVHKTAELLKAQNAGKGFSALYVSPLWRTRQTAEIIKEVLGLTGSLWKETPLLSEAWVETFEGKKSLGEDYDEVEHAHVTGGESYPDLAVRLFLFLSELCQKQNLTDVLVVTHETPARVLQYLLSSFVQETRSSQDTELLARWVFTARLKETLFDLKRSPKKFSNAELRKFDLEPFCKSFKRKF